MNVSKITSVKPTNRKIRKTKEAIKQLSESGLPKELPIEKNVYYVSAAEQFERIKDKIQVEIDKLRSKTHG